METAFVLSFAKKEFEGSAFALWRNLWGRSLSKETFPAEKGKITVIRLPMNVEAVPFLGERTRKLLYRRLEEVIPEGAMVLSAQTDILAPFQSIPNREIQNRLGAMFLPEILTALYRQWGKNILDGEVCISIKETSPLPLVRTLAPFARSLSVIAPSPDYSFVEKVMEEWGLAVSFRENVPKDCSALFLWEGDLPENIPKKTTVLSFSEEFPCALSPENILFRTPQKFVPAMLSLGKITLSHLAVLEEGIPSISDDFHVSRITKFWC